MRTKARRAGFLSGAIAAAVLTAFALPIPVSAQEQTYSFDIPSQELGTALREFAQASRQQVAFEDQAVQGKRNAAVKGDYTAGHALQQLLSGSGLAVQKGESGLFIVRDPSAAAAAGQWSVRVAQAEGAAGADDSSNAAAPASASEDVRLDEIVVTAQKRVERLQEVPVPVTAIKANSLIDSHQLRIQDYYTKVPGLSLTTLGDAGAPVATIRGLTTGGFTNPTVGAVVDDIPFSASTFTAAGYAVPDFDPTELARIEVLRGPQGTLYGANSLGGLIKYVTVDPSMDRLSGRLQVSGNGVKNGDEVGYGVRGSVNFPLGDTLAVRASGSTRRDPGFIDDPRLGAEGVNLTDSDSGRLAALWRPSDMFSLRLSALYQHTLREGANTVYRQAGLEDLQHTDLPNTGYQDSKLQAYSAAMTFKLGEAAELTSLSGFSVNEFSSAIDATHSALLSNRTLANFGVRGIANPADITTDKFTQELRLAMPLGGRIEWLAGLFYTEEKYLVNSEIFAIDESSGAVVGQWYDARRPSTFEEYAAFTDLTFKLTDRFDVQIGGRQSRIDFATGAETSTGLWNIVTLGRTATDVVLPEFSSKDDAFTYLVTPRFRVSPDLMLYARLASGYRPGGPNTSTVARAAGLPLEYGPDTTRNYEIGVKGSLLDRAFSFDASVYHIDWEDLQLQLRDASSLQIYFVNASRARSRGVELALESRPWRGSTIALSGAWSDAELAERLPPTSIVFGPVGAQLPYSSPLSGNLSIDQEFPLAGSMTAFAGASVSYVGDRKGAFQGVTAAGPTARSLFPAYTQVDLRGGLRYDSWTLNAFVNNVADKRGVLRSGRDSSLGLLFSFTYIQPRTVGLSLAKDF